MIIKRMKVYSDLEQREFGIHKAANKAAKKAWEMANARGVLVGPKTVPQFRKINASGLTLTKHELSSGILPPVRIHNGVEVREINLRPAAPIHHTINAKGTQKVLGYDSIDANKHIMKVTREDPQRGEFTRWRWKE